MARKFGSLAKPSSRQERGMLIDFDPEGGPVVRVACPPSHVGTSEALLVTAIVLDGAHS